MKAHDYVIHPPPASGTEFRNSVVFLLTKEEDMEVEILKWTSYSKAIYAGTRTIH